MVSVVNINWKCFRERLSRLEGQQKVGGHKTGHLQSLLHQHMESRPLYNILPPIHGALPPLTPTSTSQPELLPSSSQPDLSSSPQPLTPASQLDIESKVGSHSVTVEICVWYLTGCVEAVCGELVHYVTTVGLSWQPNTNRVKRDTLSLLCYYSLRY